METYAAHLPLEKHLEKPRINYSEFIAVRKPQANPFTPLTFAWVIERFLREMNGTDTGRAVRKGGLGQSNLYTLRMLQRDPLGAVIAAKLTDDDFIDYAKRRIKEVCPASINQAIGYSNVVLKYARSWKDCKDIKLEAIGDAKVFLTANGYIATSTPRTRRPTDEEVARLLAHHALPPKRKFKKLIPMVKLSLWQLRSARRIGESCRLEWGWWNKEDQTMLVRKMKHPKKRDFDKVVALPIEAQAMLLELEKERLTPNDPTELILPYTAKCVGQKHAIACKALGIPNLHLHDYRRDKGTRLVEDDGYSVEQAILVTGHETTDIFQKNYLAMKPELFKNGPRRAAAA